MIDFIIGSIESNEEGRLVVQANNIGYSMQISLIAMQEISKKAHLAHQVKVYTYLHVTENGISFYGFYDQLERELFLKLTSVSKVGPKVALSILSLYEPNRLISYIVSKDTAAISKASGVGKKLAENIIINLKDKFDHENITASDDILASASDLELQPKQEATEALVALGFDYQYCSKIINTIYSEELSSKELIARSLQMIGNKSE